MSNIELSNHHNVEVCNPLHDGYINVYPMLVNMLAPGYVIVTCKFCNGYDKKGSLSLLLSFDTT